jgi:redox-sensitive bicupin YhaK (pirin superfamily)
MAIHRPMRLWRAQPQAGERLELPLAASGRQSWLQLIDGSVALQGAEAAEGLPAHLQRGDGLGWTPGTTAPVAIAAAGSGADLLLFELG